MAVAVVHMKGIQEHVEMERMVVLEEVVPVVVMALVVQEIHQQIQIGQ